MVTACRCFTACPVAPAPEGSSAPMGNDWWEMPIEAIVTRASEAGSTRNRIALRACRSRTMLSTVRWATVAGSRVLESSRASDASDAPRSASCRVASAARWMRT